MILIYVTFPSLKEARRIGELLLRRRLAACVNFWSAGAMYRWSAKLVKGKEAVMLIKTREGNFRKVQKFIKDRHSYEMPAILEIDVDMVDSKYARWIREETTG